MRVGRRLWVSRMGGRAGAKDQRCPAWDKTALQRGSGCLTALRLGGGAGLGLLAGGSGEVGLHEGAGRRDECGAALPVQEPEAGHQQGQARATGTYECGAQAYSRSWPRQCRGPAAGGRGGQQQLAVLLLAQRRGGELACCLPSNSGPPSAPRQTQPWPTHRGGEGEGVGAGVAPRCLCHALAARLGQAARADLPPARAGGPRLRRRCRQACAPPTKS